MSHQCNDLHPAVPANRRCLRRDRAKSIADDGHASRIPTVAGLGDRRQLPGDDELEPGVLEHVGCVERHGGDTLQLFCVEHAGLDAGICAVAKVIDSLALWSYGYGAVFAMGSYEAYKGALADTTLSTSCIRWASAARCG